MCRPAEARTPPPREWRLTHNDHEMCGQGKERVLTEMFLLTSGRGPAGRRLGSDRIGACSLCREPPGLCLVS